MRYETFSVATNDIWLDAVTVLKNDYQWIMTRIYYIDITKCRRARNANRILHDGHF